MTADEFQTSVSMVDHALAYARRGFPVFPCDPADKQPLVPRDKDAHGKPIPKTGGLNKATRDEAQIRDWWRKYPRAMIGLRMGPEAGVFAIDPDVPKEPGDPDGLAAWQDLAAAHGYEPTTHAHVSPRGGRHLLFAYPADITISNSPGSLPPGIDVRGAGGYVIAPPSRMSDGREYRLERPELAFRHEPAPDWLLDLLRKPKPAPQPEPKKTSEREPPLPPNAGHSRIFMDEVPDSYIDRAVEEECAAAATAPRGQRNTALNTAAFKLGTLVGAGRLDAGTATRQLYDAAVASGLVQDDGRHAALATIESGLTSGSAKPREFPDRKAQSGASLREGSTAHPAPPPERKRIRATPFVYRDPATIPPREWIYGRHLIRRFLSTTVAPGAVGKSSLVLVEAIAMVTGRALLGIRPARPMKVWYVNLEDPLEEIERRVAAICLHYGIDRSELEGRLFLDSGRTAEIIIATRQRDGVKIVEPVIEDLTTSIIENEIDHMVVDPFVSSHRVTENANDEIDIVAKAWNRVAEIGNVSIELVHHVRKGQAGQGEYTVEDGRGAGALLAAARSARVLNLMSKDQAEKAGIPSNRGFFRVDNGKANLAPPPDKSDWFQLVSVSLGNGPPGILDYGDQVAVVEPWEWPDAFEGVGPDELRAAQSEVAGTIAAGARWRLNVQSPEWVGIPIARALKLNHDDKAHRSRISRMLKVWIETGMFEVVEGKDGKGKPRDFVEVGQHA